MVFSPRLRRLVVFTNHPVTQSDEFTAGLSQRGLGITLKWHGVSSKPLSASALMQSSQPPAELVLAECLLKLCALPLCGPFHAAGEAAQLCADQLVYRLMDS